MPILDIIGEIYLNKKPYSSRLQGVWIPLKKYKNIGFLNNAGPDPLKITKLPIQHSMLCHKYGVSLADPLWPAKSGICILPPSSN